MAGTKLRPGFSATVRTTEMVVVATVAGNVERPAEVFVGSGGELPDNLLDGEYERLDRLGAFDPLPPRPLTGIFDPVTGAQALAAKPGDEEQTTPSDIRIPTPEVLEAQERLAAAQEDVRRAFEETQNEGAPTTTTTRRSRSRS